MIIGGDGIKRWYKDDKLHREDGPAVECVDGTKNWYTNGLVHREDGPAIENSDGTKYWYYKNKFIACRSQKDFSRIIKLLAFE